MGNHDAMLDKTTQGMGPSLCQISKGEREDRPEHCAGIDEQDRVSGQG
jgi:hypothetical protein